MYTKKIVIILLIVFSFVFISCDESPRVVISEDYLIEKMSERNAEIKQYAYDFSLEYSIENNMSYMSNEGELVETSSNDILDIKIKTYANKKNKEFFTNSTIHGRDDSLNIDVDIISLGMLLESFMYEKQTFSQEYIDKMNSILDYSDMMTSHGVGEWSQIAISNSFIIDEYFSRIDVLENYLSMIKSGTIEIESEGDFYVLKVLPDSLELINIIMEITRPYINFEGLAKDEMFKFYEVEARVSQNTYDLISVQIKSDILLTKELMGDNFFPSDSERTKQSININFKDFNEKRELQAPI